jgi:hypothetical protein
MTYVKTNDPRRLAHWERLFGLEALPVKSPYPRLQVMPDGRETWAYDLDASRLPDGASSRFAHYLARKTGESYAMALYLVDGWPIDAQDLTAVVMEGEQMETAVIGAKAQRPFSRFRRWLAGLRAGRGRGVDV